MYLKINVNLEDVYKGAEVPFFLTR